MAPSNHRVIRRSWGQRVEARRQELNLSQCQLAAIAKIPQQTISRVELDRHVPRYQTMSVIARGLGTTIEALFPMESYPEELRKPRKQRVGATT